MRWWTGAFGWVIAGSALAADGPAVAPDATWYRVQTESGTAIGYAYESVRQTASGREITDHQEIALEEPRRPTELQHNPSPLRTSQVWHTVRTEDNAGQVLSIHSEATHGTRDWTRYDAAIGDGVAEITRQTPAETRNVTVTLPAGVRFDGGDALLRTWNRSATPQLSFDDFNIDTMSVDRVTVEALPGAAPDAQGRMAVVRKRYDGDLLVAVTRLLLTPDGRTAEVRQPLLGANLIVTEADRATALKYEIYRVFPNVMMKSPYRIPKEALHNHIRFRFSFQDGIVFAIPQTGEQRVAAVPGGATVDVCAHCGPGMADDRATLDKALQPTAWMQSDAPEIQEVAAPVAVQKISDDAKMKLLAGKAEKIIMRINFTGHVSALEALRKRTGDCTEEAALLAALGRAAHIPARTVSGLVYSRESYHGVSNTFMPHSWVLAYTEGAWRSYDAALGDFDTTHIALTIGDGDQRSISAAGTLAALLTWEQMAEVKAAPKP